jgi:hypothetical protein
MKLKILASVAALSVLVACGGGGSSSTAPAANSGNQQMVASLPQIKALAALKLQTNSAVAAIQADESYYAMAKNALRKASVLAYNAMVPSAYAQSSTESTSGSTCNVKQLVGVKASDSSEETLTLTGTTSACVGVTDMFDGKTYILLATEGVYKDDKTCNIVFVQKSTGALFCLGEKQRSRYNFSKQKSSSTSSAGGATPAASGTAWKTYEILQATENNQFIFLETKVDLFDDSGSKTGELIKIVRFDLRDDVAGPVATTILQGENTSWFSWTNGGDNSWFTVYGYSGLENGDLAASYQLSVSNSMFGENTWVSKSTYFRYEDATGKYDPIDVDLSQLNAQSGSTSAVSYWWDQIKCFLSSDSTGFYFVKNNTGGGSGAYMLSKGYFDTTTRQVVLSNVGSTDLCASWAPNSIMKVGGTYYGSKSQGTWNWNPATNTSTSYVTATVFKRDMSAPADVDVASVQIDRDWATPTLSMTQNGTRAYLTMGAYEKWGWNSVNSTSTKKLIGAEVYSIDMTNPLSVVTTRVLAGSENIWVSAISNLGSDGVFQFSGRDLDAALLDKVDVTIDSAGVKTIKPSADSVSSQTLAVVRL